MKNLIPLFFREHEENNLPKMMKLFFLYVWLNLTRIAGLQPVPNSIRDKENLVKHIGKRAIQMGRLFFLCSLILFCFIEPLSAKSDSIILALEDTLQMQTDSLDIAKTLYDIGGRYGKLGNYNQALEKYEKALRIRIDSLGEKHLDVAKTYHNFAHIHNNLRNSEVALELNTKALKIWESLLDSSDPQLASSRNNMGWINEGLGNYKKALEHYSKALEIWTEAFGEDHFWVAFVCNNIGFTYYNLGDYERALEFYTKSLNIGIDKPNETDLALYYNNIGITYTELGHHKKALEFFNKALKIWKSESSVNYARLVMVYGNIGNVYSHLGDHKKALEFHHKTLTIVEDELEDGRLEIANAAYRIGRVHSLLDNHSEALKWGEKALKIRKEQLGEGHSKIADCYSLKSGIYEKLKKYDQAIVLNKKALEIWTDKLGENHIYTGYSYNNLASIYNKLERHDEALVQNQKALRIRIEKLGKNHREVIESYVNIAQTHQALNNRDSATYIWDNVVNQSLERLNDTYLFLPDNQRLEYAKTFKDVYDSFYSFAAEYESEDTRRLAAYLSYNTKSLALDYSVSVRKLINNIDDEELKNLHNELNAINRNISQAELMTNEDREEKNWHLTDLRNQQEELTRKLLENKTLREKLYKTPLKWEDAHSQLKSDEAILDFIRFYEESDSTWMYYAMLTRKDVSAPQFIRITDQEAIDSLLQTNKTTGQPHYIRNDKNLQALHLKVWQPLMSHLEGVKTVHISPSGLLHQIDFGVLQNENESHLADHFEFHYYTTMRDFAKKKKTNWLSSIFGWLGEILNGAKYKNLLLFGDIAYDSPSEKEKSDTTYAIIEVSSGLDSLPYTGEEISEIGEIHEEEGGTPIYLTGNDATEDTLKHHAENLSPDIIHFATHGEYLVRLDTLATDMQHRLQTAGNPLQRSIIALSGANETWISKEYIPRSDNDGILTAYEVSHLDLSSTKLVVLSACETALGDIHDTEGVLGLQSALKLAGVQHVIVSLWKVNDKKTKELMVSFYENLLIEKQDAPTALLNAKAEMRQNDDAEPADWAGFILIE